MLPPFPRPTSRLRYFQIDNVDIEGDIPSVETLTNVYAFRIVNTKLDGSLPDFSPMRQLGMLTISYNYIEDDQVTGLKNLPRLTDLTLSNTLLRSSFPELPSSIVQLDLSNCVLQGPIPDWISQLPKLERLKAARNMFEGQIPPLPVSLKSVDLTNNLLEGPLPDISNNTVLDTLLLSYNKLSGPFPKLCQSPQIKTLDLGLNFFSGEVPNGVIERMINLQEIDLYSNEFSGPFPYALGTIKSLQTVDLSKCPCRSVHPCAEGEQ